jgi:hypothetical protein
MGGDTISVETLQTSMVNVIRLQSETQWPIFKLNSNVYLSLPCGGENQFQEVPIDSEIL